MEILLYRRLFTNNLNETANVLNGLLCKFVHFLLSERYVLIECVSGKE
jgi:hypothetical protein